MLRRARERRASPPAPAFRDPEEGVGGDDLKHVVGSIAGSEGV